MDIRVPRSGSATLSGASRLLPQILDPYLKVLAKPAGAVLAGVFGSNDTRAPLLATALARRPKWRVLQDNFR